MAELEEQSAERAQNVPERAENVPERANNIQERAQNVQEHAEDMPEGDTDNRIQPYAIHYPWRGNTLTRAEGNTTRAAHGDTGSQDSTHPYDMVTVSPEYENEGMVRTTRRVNDLESVEVVESEAGLSLPSGTARSVARDGSTVPGDDPEGLEKGTDGHTPEPEESEEAFTQDSRDYNSQISELSDTRFGHWQSPPQQLEALEVIETRAHALSVSGGRLCTLAGTSGLLTEYDTSCTPLSSTRLQLDNPLARVALTTASQQTFTVVSDSRQLSVFSREGNRLCSVETEDAIIDLDTHSNTGSSMPCVYAISQSTIYSYVLDPDGVNLILQDTVALPRSDNGRIALFDDCLYMTREYEGLVKRMDMISKEITDFATGLERPTALSVDKNSGDVLVVDDGKIVVFQPSGVERRRLRVDAPVLDLAMEGHGIFVLTRSGVQKYSYRPGERYTDDGNIREEKNPGYTYVGVQNPQSNPYDNAPRERYTDDGNIREEENPGYTYVGLQNPQSNPYDNAPVSSQEFQEYAMPGTVPESNVYAMPQPNENEEMVYGIPHQDREMVGSAHNELIGLDDDHIYRSESDSDCEYGVCDDEDSVTPRGEDSDLKTQTEREENTADGPEDELEATPQEDKDEYEVEEEPCRSRCLRSVAQGVARLCRTTGWGALTGRLGRYQLQHGDPKQNSLLKLSQTHS